MAKMVIVCVYDIAAQTYQRPMFVPAAGAASRWFEDAIKSQDKDNPMCSHPDHFQLFKVGVFDDFDCSFELYSRPELLVHGSAFKQVFV